MSKYLTWKTRNKKDLPCDQSTPCLNGGSCTNDNKGGFKCTCANGYIGDNCDTRNWLSIYFFQINKKNIWENYFKKNKALPCDLNTNQCLNGATCMNDYKGNATCTCKTGYEGVNCETRKII